MSLQPTSPNHALQRTAAGRRGCNRRALWFVPLTLVALAVATRISTPPRMWVLICFSFLIVGNVALAEDARPEAPPNDYVSAILWPKSKSGERPVYEAVAENSHDTKTIRLSVLITWRESGRDMQKTKIVTLKPGERKVIGGYSEGDGISAFRVQEGRAEFTFKPSAQP